MRYLSLFPLLFVGLSAVSAQQIGDFVYATPVVEIQESKSGDLGYQIYQTQLEIANHTLSGAMPLIQEEALVVLNTLRDLANYHIIDVMQHTQNKTEVFDDYINAMESALYTSNAIQLQLTSEMKGISSAISLCTQQKNTYDKEYLSALDQSISNSIDSIVQSSQQKSTCVSTNEALLLSKKELSDTLTAQSTVVGERYDYLLNQRDTILNHFDLLRSDYLQTILDLQKNIQKANY
ncbi:MAG: hypothetical protein WCO66_03440 [Candidatus Absconditabacteria bacterium]